MFAETLFSESVKRDSFSRYFPVNLLELILENTNFFLVNIYLFKVSNKTTRKKCEICLMLTIKTPEQCHSDVFIVNFEHTLHLFLVFLLLHLNRSLFGSFKKTFIGNSITGMVNPMVNQMARTGLINLF